MISSVTKFVCSNTKENRDILEEFSQSDNFPKWKILSEDLNEMEVKCETSEEMKLLKMELMRRSSHF